MERERQEVQLRAELTDTLLTALSSGPDAAFAVQRAAGHELVTLGLLHPDLRFVSSTGEVADRTVVQGAPVQPDPHELGNAEPLQLVRTRLYEDSRIDRREREALARLAQEILQRLGTLGPR
ncbi:hypothetical protein [Deinococcus aquiradiocola]|uniref:Uncharacterized protein n=1 Tax=Deinococcus aquiradiocola TaxID=393059 RepID=A0A917PHL1_9DEIO|nr:hypothetical protein [Deinococcus aquiradiocola]GGJ79207.1 hypothetical protein GCM10008939_23770 [Deinococcus aquiradiocola]